MCFMQIRRGDITYNMCMYFNSTYFASQTCDWFNMDKLHNNEIVES